jgi:hypothetical protein
MTPSEDVSVSCIIRVYQRATENPFALTGVVEQVLTGTRRGFRDKDELWSVLTDFCTELAGEKTELSS